MPFVYNQRVARVKVAFPSTNSCAENNLLADRSSFCSVILKNELGESTESDNKRWITNAGSRFIRLIISISDFIHVHSLSSDGVHDIFIQISLTVIPPILAVASCCPLSQSTSSSQITAPFPFYFRIASPYTQTNTLFVFLFDLLAFFFQFLEQFQSNICLVPCFLDKLCSWRPRDPENKRPAAGVLAPVLQC